MNLVQNEQVDITREDLKVYIRISISFPNKIAKNLSNAMIKLSIDNSDSIFKNLRKNIIAKTLTEISYHINSGNWEHTRKYYENDGIEELRT